MAEPFSASVAAVVSYVSTAFAASAAGTATLAQAATVFAVTTAANIGVAAILTPQVGAGGSPTEWAADPDAAIPFVMGRRGVAGKIVHRDEWGPDNRYQSLVSVYSAAGPIKSFGTFKADLETCTFAGTYGRQTSGTWKDVFWRDTRLGAQPDTALQTPAQKGDPTVSGAMPEWDASYKLSGKACSMLTAAMDSKRQRWPGDLPKCLQDIEGIFGYDPRADSTYPGGSGSCRLDDRTTWPWISNPIIGALNFELGLKENGRLVGGLGASADRIDMAAYVEAANVADANNWTLSAYWTSADSKHQVLTGFLQAGGALYAQNGGQLSCVTRGAPRTSIATVTAADTAGPIEISAAAPRLGRINAIIPKCVLESQSWATVPIDEVSVAAFETEDGGKRARGITYVFVDDPVQTSQLAAYDICDSREGITGRIPLKAYMRELKPGDAFTISEPEFVLDGLKVLVLKRDFDPITSIVTITFRSETDSKHPFALGLNPTPPTAPSLTPASLYVFPQPPLNDWTATAITIDGENGETRPAVELIGDVTVAGTDRVELQYRYRISDGAGGWDAYTAWAVWGYVDPAEGRAVIEGFPPGAQVDIRVTYVSQHGVRSTEPRDLDPVVVSEASISTRAAGSLAQDDLDEALAFAVSDRPELAAGMGTLEQVGARNLIYDPMFALGVSENTSNTAPLSLVSADTRAIAAELAVEAGDELDLVFMPRFALGTGSRLMAGGEVTLTGPLMTAAMQVRFYDEALAETGAVVELGTAATGERAEGFLDAVDIPAGTRWGQLEFAATATASGTARLQVHEPLAAYAGPNQFTVEAFRDPGDEAVSRAIGTRILDAARALEIDGLTYETAVSRAAIQVIQEVTANAARYAVSTTYAADDGIDYALVELYAADGVSRILQLAGLLAFGNATPGGDAIIAMEVRDAIVHILTELRLADDAALTQYDDSDVLRSVYGKHPVSGDLGRFLYDADGNPLEEFNQTDGTYKLYPAVATEGFVGSETEGTTTDHDLTTNSTARVPADFLDLTLYTDGSVPWIAGARISVEVDYQIVAERNAFEWFGFAENLTLQARAGAGAWGTLKSYGENLRWFSTTTNTGGVPAFVGATITVPGFFTRRETFIVPASPTYDEVRAKLVLSADDLGGGGDCISGGLNDTKITNTLKFAAARVRIAQARPGLTEIN